MLINLSKVYFARTQAVECDR